MSTKISITGKVLRRWKEQTKSGTEIFCIAVSDEAPKFPNILKMTTRDRSKIEAAVVDAKVTVEAYVGGREWTRPTDGSKCYFTDIAVASVQLVGVKAHEPEPPVVVDFEAQDELPF